MKYLSALKTIGDDQEEIGEGRRERGRESNDGAIIVAARYIIRTFANLLARGHRRSARTRGRGAILHGAEYVPCVSDFIISVRRNVRRATKARKRDLMQGIRQGPARHPGSGINEGRNPIPFPPSPSQSPLSFPSSAVSHSLASLFVRSREDGRSSRGACKIRERWNEGNSIVPLRDFASSMRS